jgi:hypothetical protein
VHVGLRVKRGGRDWDVHELKAGERALNQFGNTFG